MKRVAWGLVVVLGILHYDFWLWSDRSLVLGILPVGLAYHMMISIAAGLVWALVIRFAWPERVEEWAGEGGTSQSGGGASLDAGRGPGAR